MQHKIRSSVGYRVHVYRVCTPLHYMLAQFYEGLMTSLNYAVGVIVMYVSGSSTRMAFFDRQYYIANSLANTKALMCIENFLQLVQSANS